MLPCLPSPFRFLQHSGFPSPPALPFGAMHPGCAVLRARPWFVVLFFFAYCAPSVLCLGFDRYATQTVDCVTHYAALCFYATGEKKPLVYAPLYPPASRNMMKKTCSSEISVALLWLDFTCHVRLQSSACRGIVCRTMCVCHCVADLGTASQLHSQNIHRPSSSVRIAVGPPSSFHLLCVYAVI